MNYLIRIPENQPHRQRLEKVIADMLIFVEAGSVYVSSVNQDTSPLIITFILKKNCGQEGDALGETCHKLIKMYPDFVFKFINATWATYGFKKGKPFFIQHCTLKELVYFEPDNKVFYPSRDSSKEILKRAKKKFSKDREAALTTLRNVSLYTRNNKSIEAAFAMYQTLRYLYISASEFLTSEYTGSTCLLEQYDWVIDYAPSLKNILDKDVEADMEVLIMLATAYSCTQYNYNMEAIDPGLIDAAKAKIVLIEKEVYRLFLEYTKTCKQKIKELTTQSFLGSSIFSTKIRANYLMEQALFEIGSLISESLKTRAIYCFGYTTSHEPNIQLMSRDYTKQLPGYHFYLLVLNQEHKENAVSELQSLIREKFEGKHRVTILNHRAKYLRKQNQNQKHFFDTIAVNGLLIYNNPLHPVYSKTCVSARDIEFSKSYWENRILAAQQYLRLADNCSNDESLLKNMLLHQAVEQISVGLIDLFLSYHPNKFSFNHLFSLLEYIPEVELPFDCENVKEKELYQLLSANIEMLKHKDLHLYTIEDSFLMEEKCIGFFNEAKQVAEKKLHELGKLNIENY